MKNIKRPLTAPRATLAEGLNEAPVDPVDRDAAIEAWRLLDACLADLERAFRPATPWTPFKRWTPGQRSRYIARVRDAVFRARAEWQAATPADEAARDVENWGCIYPRSVLMLAGLRSGTVCFPPVPHRRRAYAAPYYAPRLANPLRIHGEVGISSGEFRGTYFDGEQRRPFWHRSGELDGLRLTWGWYSYRRRTAGAQRAAVEYPDQASPWLNSFLVPACRMVGGAV